MASLRAHDKRSAHERIRVERARRHSRRQNIRVSSCQPRSERRSARAIERARRRGRLLSITHNPFKQPMRGLQRDRGGCPLRLCKEAANGAIVVVIFGTRIECWLASGGNRMLVVFSGMVLVNERMPAGTKQADAAKQGQNGPNTGFFQARLHRERYRQTIANVRKAVRPYSTLLSHRTHVNRFPRALGSR